MRVCSVFCCFFIFWFILFCVYLPCSMYVYQECAWCSGEVRTSSCTHRNYRDRGLQATTQMADNWTQVFARAESTLNGWAIYPGLQYKDFGEPESRVICWYGPLSSSSIISGGQLYSVSRPFLPLSIISWRQTYPVCSSFLNINHDAVSFPEVGWL